jgi:hypothetical protein
LAAPAVAIGGDEGELELPPPGPLVGEGTVTVPTLVRVAGTEGAPVAVLLW